MKLFRLISVSLILVISSQAVFAQLRMVSKEKLASVSDPRLSTDSAAMRFETRHIVADPMTEEDEPHTYVYRFMNVGTETLAITRLVSTCSCLTATASSFSVASGDSAEIIVRYDPKGHPGKFERKIFVYTREGDDPSAVLKLSAEVSTGTDKSREWPVQMGKIRMRRSEVTFVKGQKAVEKMRFINLGPAPVELECETMFLPQPLSFRTDPKIVPSGGEGEIVISYDPSKGRLEDAVKIILKGLGLPPSQSSIKVYCKTE